MSGTSGNVFDASKESWPHRFHIRPMSDSDHGISVRLFVSVAPRKGQISARCPVCPHLWHVAVPVTKLLSPSEVSESCARLAMGLSSAMSFWPADGSTVLKEVDEVFSADFAVILEVADLLLPSRTSRVPMFSLYPSSL